MPLSFYMQILRVNNVTNKRNTPYCILFDPAIKMAVCHWFAVLMQDSSLYCKWAGLWMLELFSFKQPTGKCTL